MDSPMIVYIPILIQLLIVLGFVAFNMVATHLLGPKKSSINKDSSFECGIEVEGNARIPFSVKYFLIAILFVLFDVELIFLYPWVVNFLDLGMLGFIEMFIFIAVLMVGFVYIFKKGALKWEE
jgi:NADH-quinone oxidoreductase subunit A